MQDMYNVSSYESVIYLGSEIPIDEICGALGGKSNNTEILNGSCSYWKCLVVEVDDFREAQIVFERHCAINEKDEMVQAIKEIYPDRYKDIIVMQQRNIQLN